MYALSSSEIFSSVSGFDTFSADISFIIMMPHPDNGNNIENMVIIIRAVRRRDRE